MSIAFVHSCNSQFKKHWLVSLKRLKTLPAAILSLMFSLINICYADHGVASGPVEEKTPRYNLAAPHDSEYITDPLYYYLGEVDELSFANVKSLPWKRYSGVDVNFTFSDEGMWVKVPYLNNSELTRWVLELSWLSIENAELYWVENQSDQWRQAEKIVTNQFVHWRLDISSHAHGDLYLYVQSRDLLQVPIRILDSKTYEHFTTTTIAGVSLILGCILALALYSLLIGLKTHDACHVWFFVFHLSMVIYNVAVYGIGNIFIWTGNFSIAYHVWLFAAGMIFVSGGSYASQFLQLRDREPKLYRMIRVTQGILVSILVIYPLVSRATHLIIGVPSILLMSGLIIYASVVSMQKGVVMARNFTASWVILTFSSITYVLLLFGMIERNFFTLYSPLFAMAIESLLMGYSLSERINSYRKEGMKAQLESKAKSEFLAKMSHEIRTPMGGVIGMSELLDKTELSEQQKYYNTVIKSSGESLLCIINDILDFSKIEAGKMQLEKSTFSLEELLSDVLGIFYSKVRESGVPLYCVIDPRIDDAIEGDPTRLRQILINLLGNAFKFTNTGYVLLSVSLFDLDKKLIEFSIRDTGIGISEAQQKNLFDSFTQADSSTTRKYGGTGLGLTISQSLVELMGGKIGVDSRESHGTCFWFTAALLKNNDSVSFHFTTGKRQIVIVWLDDVLADLLVTYLIYFNIHAIVCTNRASALQWISEYNKEVVATITDRAHYSDSFSEFVQARSPDMRWVLLQDASQAIPEEPVASNAVVIPNWGLVGQFYRALIDQPALTDINKPSNDEAVGKAQSLTILVAEDNKVNQSVVSGFLKKLGHKVVLADNGQEALDLYQENNANIDLIFMDCEMPVLDGFDATKKIRTWEQGNGVSIPIVAFTSHAYAEQKEKCLASGMNHHLSKPITFAAVESLLAEIDSQNDGAADHSNLV